VAGNSRKNLRSSVEASLRRLRTDYLDLLWVHAWDYTTPVEEVMRGLDDLVSAGKVNHVALSDAPTWVASAANTLATLRGWSPLVALQAEYSLLERTAERELLPVAAAFGLVAEELGATSTQVAVAWLRQRDRRVIPILGARKLEQFQDVLGSLEVGPAASTWPAWTR
jgi:aryl-alcohol dehydrogenase-like predicted oxidoreductase